MLVKYHSSAIIGIQEKISALYRAAKRLNHIQIMSAVLNKNVQKGEL